MENIRSYSFTDFMEFFAIMNLIVNIPIFVKLTDKLDGSCYGRPELADVMISNLLGNAVRFNIDGGFIKCNIDNKFLTLTNSGSPMRTNPDDLFRRFHKNSENPQSVGLGLSIVKKITDSYGMVITYKCNDTIHELKLRYR